MHPLSHFDVLPFTFVTFPFPSDLFFYSFFLKLILFSRISILNTGKQTDVQYSLPSQEPRSQHTSKQNKNEDVVWWIQPKKAAATARATILERNQRRSGPSTPSSRINYHAVKDWQLLV